MILVKKFFQVSIVLPHLIRSCSVDDNILNNLEKKSMNINATFLPDPETGGDAHGGEGEVLGEVQVEVWPGPARTLALRKPTVRRPLFPEIVHIRWLTL